jgi:N utilization substance protein B
MSNSTPTAPIRAETSPYSRRRARESALQVLYGLDWVPNDTAAAIDDYWAKFAGEKPDGYVEVRRHGEELVHGVIDRRAELDQRLQAISHHWKLDRMSVVDRNILRLAAYELLFMGETVPRKVVINEAIEIAKKFGSEDSGSFVNGILDRIAQDRGSGAADDNLRPTARPRKPAAKQ